MNISQKVVVVALFVGLTFAAAGLTAVTLLSESFAVAQGLGNDPISGCFKTIGETEEGLAIFKIGLKIYRTSSP